MKKFIKITSFVMLLDFSILRDGFGMLFYGYHVMTSVRHI